MNIQDGTAGENPQHEPCLVCITSVFGQTPDASRASERRTASSEQMTLTRSSKSESLVSGLGRFLDASCCSEVSYCLPEHAPNVAPCFLFKAAFSLTALCQRAVCSGMRPHTLPSVNATQYLINPKRVGPQTSSVSRPTIPICNTVNAQGVDHRRVLLTGGRQQCSPRTPLQSPLQAFLRENESKEDDKGCERLNLLNPPSGMA